MRIPEASPLSQGISPDAIDRLIRRALNAGIELHAYRIVRNGRLIAAGRVAPYDDSLPHLTCSLSKSLTCMAIGLMIDQGKLRLDDTVGAVLNDESHAPGWDRVRVSHLLTMTSGLTDDPRRRFVDPAETSWLRCCLETEPGEQPGRTFRYMSANSFLLSAMVSKITGRSLRDYLDEALFTPMGMEDVRWEASPEGISAGAFGLWLTVDQMAALACLFLADGVWNGRRLIPAGFIRDAASRHVDSDSGQFTHRQQVCGYGYQFWIGAGGASRADGYAGQFITLDFENRFSLITTAGTAGAYDLLDIADEELRPAPGPADCPADGAAERREWALPAPACDEKDVAPFIGRFRDERGDRLTVAVRGDRLTIDGDGFCRVEAGVGRWQIGQYSAASITAKAAAAAREGDALRVTLRSLQTPYSYDLLLTRCDDGVEARLIPRLISRLDAFRFPAIRRYSRAE